MHASKIEINASRENSYEESLREEIARLNYQKFIKNSQTSHKDMNFFFSLVDIIISDVLK